MINFILNVVVAYLLFGFLFTSAVVIHEAKRGVLERVKFVKVVSKFIVIMFCWLPFLIIEADIF